MHKTILTLLAGALFFSCSPAPEAVETEAAPEAAETQAEPEFVSLFDGKTLSGWSLQGKQGDGYLVRNGAIAVPRHGGGNLMTEKEYADFVFRFEFRLEEGSNNGLAIRSPLTSGSMAYEGMELQIIDNKAERYKNIQPWQK